MLYRDGFCYNIIMYDVIVIGSGPAGLAAAVYAAKQQLKTFLLCEQPIIHPAESKAEMFSLAALVRQFEDMERSQPQLLGHRQQLLILKVEKNVVSFSVESSGGQIYYGKSLILATDKIADSDFNSLIAKDHLGKIKVGVNMESNIPGVFAVAEASNLSGELDLVLAAQGAVAATAVLGYLTGKNKRV